MSQAASKARRRLLRDDPHRCWWCDAPFTDELPATIDHLIPTVAGGTYAATNTVLACAPCNQARGHQRRCAACSGRIWNWRTANWIRRRDAFHLDFIRRIVNALTHHPRTAHCSPRCIEDRQAVLELDAAPTTDDLEEL